VVFGAIIARELMEHGNLKVLMQPAELIIIGGAAIGTALIGNPFTFSKMASGVAGVFGGSKFPRLPLQSTSSPMSIELSSVLREAASGSSALK
jgi:chemotaxis protein MotA